MQQEGQAEADKGAADELMPVDAFACARHNACTDLEAEVNTLLAELLVDGLIFLAVICAVPNSNDQEVVCGLLVEVESLAIEVACQCSDNCENGCTTHC